MSDAEKIHLIARNQALHTGQTVEEAEAEIRAAIGRQARLEDSLAREAAVRRDHPIDRP